MKKSIIINIKRGFLLFSFHDENDAINKINFLLKDRDIKKKRAVKKEKMLNEKVDVAQWMIDFLERKAAK